jgi:hypothetical protein
MAILGVHLSCHGIRREVPERARARMHLDHACGDVGGVIALARGETSLPI